MNSSIEHSSQSLAYLFNDELATGKTSYFNTNYLLTKDENGYYSFNSDSNYAEFNTSTRNFTVYSNPLSDHEKNFYIDGSAYSVTGLKGFYPFDSYQKVANNYLNANYYDNKGNYYYSSGWGIQAGSANHYFGMTMSAQFYYPKDGQINGNDMIFEFSGDDDVWVFIDGKLVLDLGGIHDRASGSINFATGEVKVNGQVQNGAGLFNVLNRDTFKDYSQHTIKFFYLERGNNASNCKLTFNLPTIPENSVMVGKEVTGTSGESLDYAQDVNYQFQITKKENVVANTEYEIRNSNNEVIGSDTTDSEGKFTLKDGQFAIFKGFLATDTYEVKEIGANLDDGYSIQINGTSVEIKNEEGQTDQILQSASSGPLTAGKISGVIFRNEIENTGKLIISKTLASGSESALANQNFEINVWINGERYNGSYTLKADGSTESKTASNGMISLKGNQTAEITGLPYGATFKVEEDKGSNYYPKYSLTEKENYYDEEVPTYDENGVIKSGSQNVSAKIAGDCTVTIENREVEGGTTSVTVNKTWAGDIDKQYQVPVEMTLYSGEEGSGTKVVRGENDNPYVLNKENGWTYTWSNLPGDTNYYVTETTKGFNYVASYSYSYEINSDFKDIKPCNNTYYPLGANGIIVIKKTKSDGVLIWTSEKIQDNDTTAKENIIRALEKKINGIKYNNVDFVSGSTIYSFGDDGRTITFSYDDGNVLLEFDAEKTWSFFSIGTYDKTVTATVTNSIKDEATIDIPVTKVWMDGDGTNRPENVTVQLYKKTSAGEEAVSRQKITLNKENQWKDSFENLPYWNGTKRIEYVVKEVKVGDESLLDSGYQSSITGNADTGFTITNSLAWQLAKISSTTGNGGQKIYLAGAEFTAVNADNVSYYGKSEGTNGIIQWYESKTDDNFTDSIGTMLPNGTYTITETKAPTGYQITDSGWTLTVENGYPTNVQEGETGVGTGVEGKTNTFYLENEALYDLPSAGGPGIYWYTFSGTLLMAGAALIVYRQKRKREVLLRK